MTKTYCDKCGGDCTNYVMRLYGGVTHTTSQGEQVAEDNIEPVELCGTCGPEAAAFLGLKISAYDIGMPLQDGTPVAAHP